MAYNKAREERKWKARKAAEERQMQKLGVKEDTIKQLRAHDWKGFKTEAESAHIGKDVHVGM